MAAENNPFYVRPTNIYDALISGVGGYDRANKQMTENEIKAARYAAAQSLQNGGDIRSPLAALIGAGATPDANAIASFGHQQAQEKLAAATLANTQAFQSAQIDNMQAQRRLQEQQLKQSGTKDHIIPPDPLAGNGGFIIQTGPDGSVKRIPIDAGTPAPAPQAPPAFGANAAPLNLTGPGRSITGIDYGPVQGGAAPQQVAQASAGAPATPAPAADNVAAVMQKYGGTPGDGKNWAYLASLPEKAQIALVGLTKHDINPTNYSTRIPTAGGASMRDSVITAASKFDPGYNQQDYPLIQRARTEFGPAGQSGRIVRSIDVVSDHAGTLRELALAMHNGDVQLINEISARLGKALGQPGPTNLTQAVKIVGTELIKAMGVAGAGSEGERAGFQLSQASSPAQAIGVLDDVVRPLLGGQLRGYRRSFVEGTKRPESEFNRLLSPDSLKFVEGGKSAGNQGGGGGRIVVQGGNRFQLNADGSSQFLGPAQ